MGGVARQLEVGVVGTCPNKGCNNRVRRFATVPIKGTGLDAEPSGPWWCDECLARKCKRAADKVRRRINTRSV